MATGLWGLSSLDLETELELRFPSARVQESAPRRFNHVWFGGRRSFTEGWLLGCWVCGGWSASCFLLLAGRRGGSMVGGAWGVSPADVLPWFDSVAARAKPLCDGAPSYLGCEVLVVFTLLCRWPWRCPRAASDDFGKHKRSSGLVCIFLFLQGLLCMMVWTAVPSVLFE